MENEIKIPLKYRINYYKRLYFDRKTRLACYTILFLLLTILVLVHALKIENLSEKRPEFFYQLLTNGEYSEDFLFETPKAYESKILFQFEQNKVFSDCVENGVIVSHSSFWHAIANNENVWIEIIEDNKLYCDYLQGIHKNYDSIKSFADDFIVVENGLLAVVIFIGGIVFFVMTVILFGYRMFFYVVLAILSVLFGLEKVSNNVITFYLIRLASEYSSTLTEGDFYWLNQGLNYILEGFMAMAFLDVTVQLIQADKKNRADDRIIYESRYVVASLQLQVDYLEKYKNSQVRVIMRVPNYFPICQIYTWTEEYKMDFYMKMRLQEKMFKSEKGKRWYDSFRACYEEGKTICDFLDFLRTNSDELLISEYIDKFIDGRNKLVKLEESIFMQRKNVLLGDSFNNKR